MAYFVLLWTSVKHGKGGVRGFSPVSCVNRARGYSAAVAELDATVADHHVALLHPKDLMNGTIPYPKSLSPSAVMEFKKCPQSYLFQYLWGLKQPTNEALAKGSMCHSALEKVFDLDPSTRSLENLQNLFRSSWAEHRTDDTYRPLFEDAETKEWDVQAEREWGLSGLKLLENYYKIEDPRQVPRPNPVQREVWVVSKLSIDPSQGVTHPHQTDKEQKPEDIPSFLVRGIVDRLDMVRVKRHVALRIVDYKTGKAPNLKYSQRMNEQIADEAFYQLKIYALLLREKAAEKLNGMDLRWLRLLHLTSHSGEAKYLDMDLGPTQEERDRVLQEVHADLSQIWTDIHALVATQDPKAFVGCDRSFCYCHSCRDKFLEGTVWQPKKAP